MVWGSSRPYNFLEACAQNTNSDLLFTSSRNETGVPTNRDNYIHTQVTGIYGSYLLERMRGQVQSTVNQSIHIYPKDKKNVHTWLWSTSMSIVSLSSPSIRPSVSWGLSNVVSLSTWVASPVFFIGGLCFSKIRYLHWINSNMAFALDKRTRNATVALTWNT